MTTAEVYDKTSKILDAIEKCSCEHCLKILKNGIGNQPIPDADDTIPEPTGNDNHV
jgi:hypothetical protein